VTTVLDRWGNSLGVRLPKSVADALGLREGDRVSVELVDASVVIKRAKPRYTLSELLDGLTAEMLHGEVESSGPLGAEDVW
jgi:antitoxin MazE